MPLTDTLNSVNDEASFLSFARALLADRNEEIQMEHNDPSSPYSSGARGWQNQTIEHYLEGAIEWAEATSFGLSQGLGKDNPWKRFAVFLYCGKIYE